MSVKFSHPLSQEDLQRLRERYPEQRVQAIVSLVGLQDSEEPFDGDSGVLVTDGDEEPGEADEEDLIGDPGETFDPSNHTVDEVNAFLKGASPETISAVLEAEADGRGRSGILNR